MNPMILPQTSGCGVLHRGSSTVSVKPSVRRSSDARRPEVHTHAELASGMQRNVSIAQHLRFQHLSLYLCKDLERIYLVWSGLKSRPWMCLLSLLLLLLVLPRHTLTARRDQFVFWEMPPNQFVSVINVCWCCIICFYTNHKAKGFNAKACTWLFVDGMGQIKISSCQSLCLARRLWDIPASSIVRHTVCCVLECCIIKRSQVEMLSILSKWYLLQQLGEREATQAETVGGFGEKPLGFYDTSHVIRCVIFCASWIIIALSFICNLRNVKISLSACYILRCMQLDILFFLMRWVQANWKKFQHEFHRAQQVQLCFKSVLARGSHNDGFWARPLKLLADFVYVPLMCHRIAMIKAGAVPTQEMFEGVSTALCCSGGQMALCNWLGFQQDDVNRMPPCCLMWTWISIGIRHQVMRWFRDV